METQLRQLMGWEKNVWEEFLRLGTESMTNSIHGLHEIGIADDTYSRGLFLSEETSNDVISFAMRPRTPYVSKLNRIAMSDEKVTRFLAKQEIDLTNVDCIEVRRLFIEGRFVFIDVRCLNAKSSTGTMRFYIDFSSKEEAQVQHDKNQYKDWYENELRWNNQYQGTGEDE